MLSYSSLEEQAEQRYRQEQPLAGKIREQCLFAITGLSWPRSLPSSVSLGLISVPHLTDLPQTFSFISFLCLADLLPVKCCVVLQEDEQPFGFSFFLFTTLFAFWSLNNTYCPPWSLELVSHVGAYGCRQAIGLEQAGKVQSSWCPVPLPLSLFSLANFSPSHFPRAAWRWEDWSERG